MMRDEMAAKCKPEKIGTQTVCMGSVELTAKHLTDAHGSTPTAKRNDILAEARIGCSQKCGCQSASAEFQMKKNGNNQEVEFVVARCSQSPATLALGDTLKT